MLHSPQFRGSSSAGPRGHNHVSHHSRSTRAPHTTLHSHLASCCMTSFHTTFLPLSPSFCHSHSLSFCQNPRAHGRLVTGSLMGTDGAEKHTRAAGDELSPSRRQDPTEGWKHILQELSSCAVGAMHFQDHLRKHRLQGSHFMETIHCIINYGLNNSRNAHGGTRGFTLHEQHSPI